MSNVNTITTKVAHIGHHREDRAFVHRGVEPRGQRVLRLHGAGPLAAHRASSSSTAATNFHRRHVVANHPDQGAADRPRDGAGILALVGCVVAADSIGFRAGRSDHPRHPAGGPDARARRSRRQVHLHHHQERDRLHPVDITGNCNQ